MSILKDFVELSRSNKLRIAVVGDCMIDEWWPVEVERISPEAPVPVWKSGGCAGNVISPGGAGNVASQLNRWGVLVELYGLLDCDAKTCYETRFRLNADNCVDLGTTNIPRKI